MMCLAYVSTYGGESNSANFMKDSAMAKLGNDDNYKQAQVALAGGYGTKLCNF